MANRDIISTVASQLTESTDCRIAREVCDTLGLSFVPRPERLFQSQQRVVWLIRASATPEAVRRGIHGARRDVAREDSPMIVLVNSAGLDDAQIESITVVPDPECYVLPIDDAERDRELAPQLSQLLSWLTRSMCDPLTILHLSDLQFGRHHRYPKGDDSYQTLFAKQVDDVEYLKEKYNVHPNAVVVTGDVAEGSVPQEYALARSFFEKLAAKLKLPRERIVIVPGNHDVNWSLCQAARLTSEATERDFDEPYIDKFGNYRGFYNELFKGIFQFDESNLFQVHEFRAEKTLIVGFNSCVRESERDEDHYGWIGLEQVHAARARCDEIDADGRWLRIAAMHHNFLCGSDLDNENLRDADQIRPALEKGGFHLILHGHRHIAHIEQRKQVQAKAPLTILATGSAGLDAETLPDHPNQYQIIDIADGNRVTLYMRQYSAQTIGDAGQGKWTADPTVEEKEGIVQFELGLRAERMRAEPKFAANAFPEAKKRFLNYVRQEHRFLQLSGFGSAMRANLELEPLYVSLRAVPGHVEAEPDKQQPRAMDRLEALEIGPALDYARKQDCSGLVILGDPGCGKTTLMKYVALSLARGRPKRETGIPSGRVPLFLPLRCVRGFDVAMAQALRAYYNDPNLSLPADFFERVLDSGRCLLLLDGLDEVATVDRRQQALDWIEAEGKVHPDNPILVTSRFAGYKGKARLPANYLEMHVRDFSDDDVGRFVRQWYVQVETRLRDDDAHARDVARRLSDDLLAHLEPGTHLHGLCRNPLMLQIICLLHRSQGSMPKRRTELYEECIKVLLQKWDEAKGLEVYLTATEARQVLRPLALWLHKEEGRTYAEADQVREILLPHLARVKRDTREAEEQLDRVLTSVRDRSGLFVGFDVTRYGFHHLSFQEFLAAEEIVKQGDPGPLIEPFGRSWWREPTLLALGMDDPRFQEAFFEALIAADAFTDNIDFALTCMREALSPGAKPFKRVFGDAKVPWRVRYNCVLLLRELGGPEAIEALQLALNCRHKQVAAAARDALIKLGALEQPTPKPGARPKLIVNETDGTELIRIPAGEFLMGSDARDNERPQQSVHLDEYFIAKYPVTNGQYWKFIEEAGRDEPYYWDDKRFNRPNQPVVGVTWRDAVAYCEWAGLSLPTEAQWEKAARGTDGRDWPWGNTEPTEKHCNFSENMGRTTDVGSYPDGASPYGCLDMAGNVWEWCSTRWRDSQIDPTDDDLESDAGRVVRGGCWYWGPDEVRCSHRDRFLPAYCRDDIGFRCAQ